MFNRHVWEADAGETVIHKLGGRIKLLLLAALGVGVVLVDSPRTLFLLFLATLAGHAAAKSSLSRWSLLILFLLFGIWGSMISQGIFYNQEPRTPIICLLEPAAPLVGPITGGVFIYREGLAYGAVQALRSCIMLTYGLLLCWTTDPRDMLRSFLFWRMPYKLAFMAVTGLRFLPVIVMETVTVIAAQRLRGFEACRRLSPAGVIRTAFQTLWPVLARSLRRAVTLSMSVESRGFGRTRTLSQPLAAGWEKLAIAGCLAIVALLIAAKMLHVLQYNGWVYFPSCRSVYDFARLWL
ncbi:MAG TPA: energy-coupling factor transporter transmembrane component T [Selenomonadales bacterium]|nr:energy-coupling factor transporter transmembrane component T [Selenomonadales bacterium]